MTDIVLTILGGLVSVLCVLFIIYIAYLQILFLRKGIKFFDDQAQDRDYKQWLARQQHNDDSEKNG